MTLPRTMTLHDSHTILAIKVACSRREEKPLLEFYRESYKNLLSIDGEKSKWWVFDAVFAAIQTAIQNIQTYIERVSEGKDNNIPFRKNFVCFFFFWFIFIENLKKGKINLYSFSHI